MAKEPGYFTFIKNDGTSTSTSVTAKYDTMTAPSISNIAGVDWTRSNYNFVEWNTDSNGTGASCSPGDTIDWDTYGVCYAIWEEKHEVTIYYKGSTIAGMDASGTKTLNTEGTWVEADISVEYDRPTAPTPVYQSKTVNPSTSSQTVSADTGYDALSSVTVNAMPTGTAGAPIATKGTVTNHSVSLTPTVTNTTGYIVGGTRAGNIVTVSASELVSGTLSITSNASGINVANYASVDVNVSGGGGDDEFVNFIENYNFTGKFITISNSTITKIGSYAFYSCTNLTEVSFPSCSTIYNAAFQGCSRLQTISFPSCTTIWSSAFMYCSSLASANFPTCTEIRSYAFDYCRNLSAISFPLCSTIYDGAFTGCSNLISVDLPSCTTIRGAFSNCSNLTTVNLPSCSIIGSNAFSNCYNLTNISVPMCSTVSSSAFVNCSNLTTVSFPCGKYFYSYAFYSCTRLISLYLMSTSVARLSSPNAFYSTPINGYTTDTGGVYGSIFVPSSLYSSYITATNWKSYSSRFVSV